MDQSLTQIVSDYLATIDADRYPIESREPLIKKLEEDQAAKLELLAPIVSLPSVDEERSPDDRKAALSERMQALKILGSSYDLTPLDILITRDALRATPQAFDSLCL